MSGDSESCVFDMEGRVVSILDAGLGRKQRRDHRQTEWIDINATLVTPIQWVLDDIGTETGLRVKIL